MTVATVAPTDLEIHTALNDARWLLVNYGWRQHIVGNTKQGFSADGAISAATGHSRALHMAARQVFKRAIGNFEPGPWNDVYGRTRGEVDRTFFRAMDLVKGGA